MRELLFNADSNYGLLVTEGGLASTYAYRNLFFSSTGRRRCVQLAPAIEKFLHVSLVCIEDAEAGYVNSTIFNNFTLPPFVHNLFEIEGHVRGGEMKSE